MALCPVVFSYQSNTHQRHRQKGNIMATDARTLTYKQQNELYVLKRNRPASTFRKHNLIVRASVRYGVPTASIAEAIGLSVRQVQRIVQGA